MWLDGAPLRILSYMLASSVQPDPGQLGLSSSEVSQQIVYLDRRKKSGVAIGRLLRIGQYKPSLPDPFMLQTWSEPVTDCSNEKFDCVRAGSIIIFKPVVAPRPNQVYTYLGRVARVVGCDRSGVCTIEITGEESGGSPRPLLVYFRLSGRGIVSLGFEPSPGNAKRASNRFRLVGTRGLFASRTARQ